MDQFCSQCIKYAICEISENRGYQGIRKDALYILVDVVLDYLRKVGYTTKLLTELSLRVQSNLVDVEHGLLKHHMNRRKMVTLLELDQSRFPVTRPPKPAQTEGKLIPRKDMEEVEDQEGHIPGYLPTLPPAHTYSFTLEDEEEYEEKITQIRAKRKRQVEGTLVRLYGERGKQMMEGNHNYIDPSRTLEEWRMQSEWMMKNKMQRVGEGDIPLEKGILHYKVLECYENERKLRLVRVNPQDETSEKKRKRVRGNMILSMTHKDGLEIPATAQINH